MIEFKPTINEDVRRLLMSTEETVPASWIAPIVKMDPRVIIKYAREGKWNLGAYVVSGSHVKFFRRDFLQKCGYVLEEESPPRTLTDLLEEAIELIRVQNALLTETLARITKKDPLAAATADGSEKGVSDV